MSPFIHNLEEAKKRLGINDGGPNSFRPVMFLVHDGLLNRADQNHGALIIIWDAAQRGLMVEETLPLFGEHFAAVTRKPLDNDHQNIRALWKHSPKAYVGSIVTFYGDPIVPKENL